MGLDSLKKNNFYLLIFLLLSISVFSESQKVYSITRYKDLYIKLEKLQIESGISPISTAYPYTSSEIEYILSSIDVNSLSTPGQETYNSVLDSLDLDIGKNGFSSNLDIYVNAETYIQTNSDNDTWIYDYNDRKAVVEFDFTMDINDIFWADLSLPLQKGLDYNRHSSGETSNISLLWNLDQIDAQFPFIAQSSVGGDNWNLQFGRDLLNYGVGKSGSFMLSDDASYHDYFKGTTYWNKFKYTMTMVNIEPLDVDGLDQYIEYTTVLNTDDEEVSVETSESRNRLKILIDHSFEFRPFKNLSIALHEVNIRGGGEMTFGMLNPFMIMHNLALTDKRFTVLGNSISIVSSIYTPFKNLSIYGEFVLDQFETPSEADRQDEVAAGDPNSFGFLVGTNYLLNLNSAAILFNFEYAYTNPHLYRSSNSWSIYALTRLYHSVYNDSNDLKIEPLGYEYGPDISLINVSAHGSFLNDNLTIYLEYINILKGESNLDDHTEQGQEAFDKETPSGDVIFKRNIITLKAEYRLLDNVSIYSQLNGLYFQNVGNLDSEDLTDFQIVFGISSKF